MRLSAICPAFLLHGVCVEALVTEGFILMQAESDLRANKQVIKDHQLAKCRKALLPMAVLNPGLVLGSVPKGHFASAKVTHLTAWQLLRVCQLSGHTLMHVWLDVQP